MIIIKVLKSNCYHKNNNDNEEFILFFYFNLHINNDI